MAVVAGVVGAVVRRAVMRNRDVNWMNRPKGHYEKGHSADRDHRTKEYP